MGHAMYSVDPDVLVHITCDCKNCLQSAYVRINSWPYDDAQLTQAVRQAGWVKREWNFLCPEHAQVDGMMRVTSYIFDDPTHGWVIVGKDKMIEMFRSCLSEMENGEEVFFRVKRYDMIAGKMEAASKERKDERPSVG